MDTEAKRKYHHGDLRRAVIEAAVALTKTHGPSEWTMRQVAEAAGVSVAAPYRHFKDKEAVLVAIAIEGFRILEDAIRDNAQAGPEGIAEQQAFAHLTDSYARFSVEFPEYFQLMFLSGLRPDQHPMLREATRRLFDEFERVVNPASGAPHAALTLYVAMQGLGQMRVLGALNALDLGDADLPGSIAKTLLQGVLPRD